MRHETAGAAPWLGAAAQAMWAIGKPTRRRPRVVPSRPKGRFRSASGASPRLPDVPHRAARGSYRMRSKRRSHDASNPDGGCSILHEDLARHRREAARTVVGDDDALGGLEAPVVEPQAGHEVEGHAGLQLDRKSTRLNYSP